VERRNLPRLEDRREIHSGAGRARWDHHVGDVAPVLAPHVAEQLDREHASGGHELRTVAGHQAAAHEGVELHVQRSHLLPQLVTTTTNESGGMSYPARHMAPASAKPMARAP